MQKWEYLVSNIEGLESAEIENAWDYLGKMGWELVNANKNRGYFKRPLQEQSNVDSNV